MRGAHVDTDAGNCKKAWQGQMQAAREAHVDEHILGQAIKGTKQDQRYKHGEVWDSFSYRERYMGIHPETSMGALSGIWILRGIQKGHIQRHGGMADTEAWA